MTATMRLFTIEARRSVALWFFPLMALVACWYADSRMSPIGVSLWRHNSAQIGETLILLAPLMGGVAAWAAGRDRRRGVSDLLATTPLPAARRQLSGWGGTLVWGIAAYLVAGAFIVMVTLRANAWGTPSLAPVIIGLLTIVAASAIGYLVGSLIPSRLAPPLVPVALFLSIGLLNSGWFHDDSVTLLSPWTLIDRQLFQNPEAVFYEPAPLHPLPMSLWLVGLTGLALAGVVLARRRGVAVWSGLACSAVVAATGAALLLNAYDDVFQFGVPWERAELVPYTPVCVERSIPVCAHPAFESLLDEQADRIDLLIEPLRWLPGAPARAEQLPYASGMYADGTLTIDPISSGVEMAALALVQAPVEPGPGWNLQMHVQPEQAVIARWLARRVDAASFEQWDIMLHDPVSGGTIRDPIQNEIDAAAARFSALDSDTQRRWLEENYVNLREGLLSLEDLP
ncbi:MAG: hypothetical protein WEC79_03295 [Thermomicrobiales bacterium]